MSVIAELRISAEDFELGRIFDLERDATVELETMVPLGTRAVPFFTVHRDETESFESTVRNHPSVRGLREVDAHEDQTLYALDWKSDRDLVIQGIDESEGQLLEATGTASAWQFELRFPSHDHLSRFRTHCEDGHVEIEVERIYNPTSPDSGQWYGVTDAQRETLMYAVETGYYSLPRGISAKELGEEFDISDQAVTERLRRAIVTLVRNTLLATEEDVDTRDE